MDVNTLKNIPSWEWPPNAGSLVLDILRDPGANPSDRTIAAGLAGDFTVINDKLAAALVAVIKNGDESDNLRARAAVSLGPVLEYACTFGLGSDDCAISPEMADRIKESFRSLYKDTDVPKEVRRRILEVSVRAPQDWHPKAVRAAYRGDDEDYILTAVFCMGFVPGFGAELMEAMESDNPALRHEAVRAAGNWQVDMDWLDIDSPLTSGEDNNPLLQSAIKARTGIPSRNIEPTHDLPDCSDNDEVLDALEGFLSMDDLPWDDEFIEIDEDEDSFD